MQLPIVTILVSVGISGLCGIFVTFDFRGFVTFGGSTVAFEGSLLSGSKKRFIKFVGLSSFSI